MAWIHIFDRWGGKDEEAKEDDERKDPAQDEDALSSDDSVRFQVSFCLILKPILASVVPTIRIWFTFIQWINLFWKQSDESPSPRHTLQRPSQRNARPSDNMEEWWSRLLVKICEIVSRQLLAPIKKSWTICTDEIELDCFVIYDNNASKWKDKDM